MVKYNEELAQAGILLAADGLKPSSQGARVRFSGQSRIVTDGPFAETKELIAGFWMWKVNSLAEAIEWVKRCPNPMPEDSEIEIRPVFEPEDFGDVLTPELRDQDAAIRAKTLGLSIPTFQHGTDLLVAGLNASYGNEDTRAKIPRQWERLAPHLGKVPGQIGQDAYGVCHASGPDCPFEYLAGVAVSSPDRLPEGFTTVKVDARRYAVFTHLGHVSSLPATIDTIWTQWAPDCGLPVGTGRPASSDTRPSSTLARAWVAWRCGSHSGRRVERCTLRSATPKSIDPKWRRSLRRSTPGSWISWAKAAMTSRSSPK